MMDNDTKNKVKEVIESWSHKKLAYESKRANAKGFSSVEEYVASKIAPTVEPQKIEKEINPDWKKTDPDGTPIFDLGVFNVNPYKRIPTKEMFEWWLLDIGSKDPSDFPEHKEGTPVRNTTSGIHSVIYFFLGVMFHPKKSKYDKTVVYHWFRELQHLITNDRMFWLLFTKFYVDDENSLNKDELEKSNRLSVPLEDRMKLHQDFLKVKGENWSLGGLSDEYQNKRLREYNDDDYITVYRAFSVQAKRRDENGKLVRGKPVRKGIARTSDEGGIHMEGNGFSYSFSKMSALRLSHNINTHIIKKHCKVDDKEATKILKNWVSERHLEYVEMYDGFYRALGVFKVKKKDVLICTDARDEDELIANPKDVILVDYKFLNSIHFIATQTAVHFGKHLSEQKLMTIANLDDVFDYFYEWVRETEKEKSGFVASVLKKEIKAGKTVELLVETIRGQLDAPPRNDEERFMHIYKRADGLWDLGFFGHIFYPLKKNRNLYQPRKFGVTKVELSIPDYLKKPKLNIFAENNASERTWFNPNP